MSGAVSGSRERIDPQQRKEVARPSARFSRALSPTYTHGMAKRQVRRPFSQVAAAQPPVFDAARDEMYQQIIQCGVIGADPDHQTEWFDETMRYFTDRYHELSQDELARLRTLGERFVRPPRQVAAAQPGPAA